MNYAQGTIGRVFVLKFEDKDDLLEAVKEVARKENVRAATVMLLGGMRTAGVVAGPKEAVIPPEPMWVNFSDAREVVGFGTIFWTADGPAVHLHTAAGRGSETLVGCVRKDSSVYLVVEAVITEIAGIEAKKEPDAGTGLMMLQFAQGKKA